MQFRHLLDTRIGDYHAMVRMAEVESIGAGGGSIAYLDVAGQFQVGPRSAGADPGPCCYGRGGREPTATDCQVALGRIDPTAFLGGKLPLKPELARGAIETFLARPLGVSAEAAALGAMSILTHSMIQAIELNSVRRGYDPRDFSLVAFGGAGPLFACDIARELAIPTVIIPPYPGLTSALGLLTSDIAYDCSRTVMQSLDRPDIARLAAVYAELEASARDQLVRDGIDHAAMTFLRFADCRYQGQGYELATTAPGGAFDEGFAARLSDAFHEAHRRRYGQAFPDKTVQLVNLRVSGIGRIPRVHAKRIAAGGPIPEEALRSREVVFQIDGAPVAVATRCYARARLKAGNVIAGPAIIEQMDSTTALPPGLLARVDSFGNLVIALG